MPLCAHPRTHTFTYLTLAHAHLGHMHGSRWAIVVGRVFLLALPHAVSHHADLGARAVALPLVLCDLEAVVARSVWPRRHGCVAHLAVGVDLPAFPVAVPPALQLLLFQISLLLLSVILASLRLAGALRQRRFPRQHCAPGPHGAGWIIPEVQHVWRGNDDRVHACL